MLSEHKPISVAFSICSSNPKWRREVMTYTGIDCVSWFLSKIKEVVAEIKHIYSKAMPMKQLSYAQRLWNGTQTKCYLCGVEFTSKNRKHADHCHINGEYRGAACAYCNQNNLSLKGTSIPILFHNFIGYDSRLLMKHIEDLEVSVIAKSTEKIKCASIFFEQDGKLQKGVARFIDSLAFLNSNLDKLSSLLLLEDKEYLGQYLLYKCLVKFRGRQAVDILYEGRQRHDDEMQEVIQERRQHYCYVGTGNLSPQDDDYRNKIYEDV